MARPPCGAFDRSSGWTPGGIGDRSPRLWELRAISTPARDEAAPLEGQAFLARIREAAARGGARHDLRRKNPALLLAFLAFHEREQHVGGRLSEVVNGLAHRGERRREM